MSGCPPEEILAGFLDGDVSGEELVQLESHLLRCDECREAASCEGMHINQVRAHGYAQMRPIRAPGSGLRASGQEPR